MSLGIADCLHLDVAMVLEIHAEAISRFGGSPGTRDVALLESAVAAPQATFAGDSLYEDLIDIAAAYLYYLCSNHPFFDGNKRAALGACLVFLRLNGLEPTADGPHWEKLTLGVATSDFNREQTTELLRQMVKRPRHAK